ncbi:hypothetical protein WOC76_16150 [Methylocystis sp. IM3]|jgi:hypothetical protein|uniref:hypothetical protein n=1 Tax=unclassified Methylocystis TaxID=2625913 RepID=UPI000F94D31A|nr:MAG: hypothetical protein EKK29_08605 [Hyphomicrobiales bacterium]
MSRRGVLFLAAGAAALLLLLWFFWPAGEDETATLIERGAGHDLVAACNAAANGRVRFTPGDVRRASAEIPNGVVAFASMLEARRDGLVCRWNGVDPPAIARE